MSEFDDEWLRYELIERIGLSEESGDLLVRWSSLCRDGRDPVAFVGAGFSLNAVAAPGYAREEPRASLWHEVAQRLRSALPAEERNEGDPLWLAELYERRYGRQAVDSLLRETVPDHKLAPGEAHLALLRTRWAAVLTTNYDHLIDKAHRALGGPRNVHISWNDSRLAERPHTADALEIVHLHGRFDSGCPLTFTLEDYRSYPQRHPGMIAKVRQLFLQHPLLAVGFGATDPNFIAWSGWVNDVVGHNRPMHVSLMVNRDAKLPSVIRQGTWASRLLFAACKPQQLKDVLERIGQYLSGKARPVDSWIEALQRSTTAEALLDRMFTALRLSSSKRGPRSHDSAIQRVVTAAFERLLVLRHGENAADGLRRSFSAVDPKIGQALIKAGQTLDLDALWTIEKKRVLIRETFGRSWADLVLRLLNMYRTKHVRIAGVAFDFSEQQDASAEVTRYVEFLRLCEVATSGGKVEVTIPLSPEERNELQDQSALALLRKGGVPRVHTIPGTAQDLRRAGFLAAMEGDWNSAADRYGRAARTSREEGESPFSEWVSLRAAQFATRIAEQPVEASWSDRIAQIEHEEREGVTWWESRLESQTSDLIKQLRNSTRSTNLFGVPDFESHMDTVRSAEELWMNPGQVGRAAEVAAELAWHDGHRAQAAEVFARYGSGRLRDLVREEREELDPSVIGVLLNHGRWPHDWYARVCALTHAVDSMTSQDLVRLGAWLQGCSQALENCRGSYLNGGGVASHRAFGLEQVVEALTARWSLGAFSVVNSESAAFAPLIARYVRQGLFLHPYARLPWRRWLASGECTPETAGTYFNAALSAARSLRADSLALYAIGLGVPLDQTATARALAIAEDPETSPAASVMLLQRLNPEAVGPLLETMARRLGPDPDPVYAFVQPGVAVTDAQVVEVLKWAEQRLAGAKDSFFDQGVIRAAGAAAGAFLSHPACGARARSVLERALDRSPEALVGLQIGVLAADQALVARALHWLQSTCHDSEVSTSRQRQLALHALARVASLHPQALPTDWMVSVITWLSSSDVLVARDAATVLVWRLKSKSPAVPAERQLLISSLKSRASDTRLSVRVALAWGSAVDPKEFSDVISALTKDPRMGIAAALADRVVADA